MGALGSWGLCACRPSSGGLRGGLCCTGLSGSGPVATPFMASAQRVSALLGHLPPLLLMDREPWTSLASGQLCPGLLPLTYARPVLRAVCAMS